MFGDCISLLSRQITCSLISLAKMQERGIVCPENIVDANTLDVTQVEQTTNANNILRSVKYSFKLKNFQQQILPSYVKQKKIEAKDEDIFPSLTFFALVSEKQHSASIDLKQSCEKKFIFDGLSFFYDNNLLDQCSFSASNLDIKKTINIRNFVVSNSNFSLKITEAAFAERYLYSQRQQLGKKETLQGINTLLITSKKLDSDFSFELFQKKEDTFVLEVTRKNDIIPQQSIYFNIAFGFLFESRFVVYDRPQQDIDYSPLLDRDNEVFYKRKILFASFKQVSFQKYNRANLFRMLKCKPLQDKGCQTEKNNFAFHKFVFSDPIDRRKKAFLYQRFYRFLTNNSISKKFFKIFTFLKDFRIWLILIIICLNNNWLIRGIGIIAALKFLFF